MKKSLLLLLMFMSVNLTQAREVTPPPVIFNEITDDALVITAIGEGTVTLYVQYIDMETGEMTTETYVGKGTVTHEIPRGDEDAYINYWATAQANADTDPGITAVEYFVEVPAKEGIEPPPEYHDDGVWLITKDRYGHEIWHEMILDNGDYGTSIELYYSRYGGFNPEIDDRPTVPLYIVIYGVRYGAPSPNRPPVLGNAMDNPLNEGDNCYVLQTGCRYRIGVTLIHENEVINPYLYAIELPWSIQEDPTDYIMGDVDTNSIVSIADVVTMIDSLLSGNTSILNMANADCDGDGKLTITDVTLVIDYLLTRKW